MKGKIIETSDKDKVLVFGTAKLNVGDSFTQNYHIGVDLKTGQVVDVATNYPIEVNYTELDQQALIVFATALHALATLPNRVVTISAKARSGKDALAKAIKSKVSSVHILSLGAPIYAARDIIYGKPPVGDKDRPSLITIGQGLRKVDPNVWIKAWLRTALSHDSPIVCPDVRQPNEYTFFESLGAFRLGIEVDEEDRKAMIVKLDGQKALDESLLKDETESHFESFEYDHIIQNDYIRDLSYPVVADILPLLRKKGW